jgi:hypothetical protein
MASLDAIPDASRNGRLIPPDAWAWWQARRWTYNLTLAAGGWTAYGLGIGLNQAFGHPVWQSWRGGLAMTLFLGTVYLLVMGAANVCFLLGPTVEAWVAPTEVDRYRRTAWAMGRWGSLIVPATFPLVQLAMLLARG